MNICWRIKPRYKSDTLEAILNRMAFGKKHSYLDAPLYFEDFKFPKRFSSPREKFIQFCVLKIKYKSFENEYCREMAPSKLYYRENFVCCLFIYLLAFFAS